MNEKTPEMHNRDDMHNYCHLTAGGGDSNGLGYPQKKSNKNAVRENNDINTIPQ